MAFFSISKDGGALFLLLTILASAVVGYHVHINDNYMLNVVVNNVTKRIEFYIEATNVKGWVGIGVNDHGKNMIGGDLFIGGVNANGSYGGDYHIPNDGSNGPPIKDAQEDWTYDVTEINGTTYVNASRPFNTSDTQHDTEITDKFTNLLWAYHLTSDNLVHHDKSGSYSVNLITGVPNQESGADVISVCVGTLLMGLVAAVLKH